MDLARATVEVVGERAAEAAERTTDDLRGRIHDATDSARENVAAHVDPEAMAAVGSQVKRVAVMAAPFAPVEVLISAGAIALVIKIAEVKGLLESEAARPLKLLAQQINDVAPLDENRLLGAVPKLLELGILKRVMGDGPAAARVRTAAKLAASSGAVRNAVGRMRRGPGPTGTGQSL